MIHPDRIHQLSNKPIVSGDIVVYWMQASQREGCNHALEYAIAEANRLNQPLVAYFGLTDDYPGANLRHYSFMVDGLKRTALDLARRGIQLAAVQASPPLGMESLSRQASLIVTDFGYTRIQRRWREQAAECANCSLVAIESDVAIPVQAACPKEAWSAAVIRRRIELLLTEYLRPVERTRLRHNSTDLDLPMPNRAFLSTVLQHLRIDRSVAPVSGVTGGPKEARRRLASFIDHKLRKYADLRNDPTKGMTSEVSPYLHYGQISPIEIALEVGNASPSHAKAFLEELIVRRELSINFCWYNPDYDRYACLPSWARATLEKHAGDKREHLYPRSAWESADTHDQYWNAAQKELLLTGRTHGYMRMYWGKKILEWSKSPEEAFDTAVYLNDKYALDGRDPNGYAGVAWCFGKHDRPWAERPVFGMVRYMNEAGLRRKFNADAYVSRIEALAE